MAVYPFPQPPESPQPSLCAFPYPLRAGLYFRDHLAQVLMPQREETLAGCSPYISHSPHPLGPPQGLSLSQSVSCNTYRRGGPTAPCMSDSSQLSLAVVSLSSKKKKKCKGDRRNRVKHSSLTALGKGQELEDQGGRSRNYSCLGPKTAQRGEEARKLSG